MDVSYPANLIGTLIHGMLRLKKAHMIAYDTVRRGSNSLGGYEDLGPHENSYESSLHFRSSNKQRAD